MDLHLLAALSDGSLTAPQVRNLLDRKGRPLLPSNRLDGLRQGSGLSAGIAAALSDSEDARTLLAGSAEDPDAVRALLAGARLRRRALPLEDVAPLLTGADKQVAVAAMRYLEAWDTREARELVRKAYPDEYLVFGSRMSWDPGHFSYRQLDAIERRLMAQMTGPDAPDAIYALATCGYWSSGKEISIGVRGENAELIVRDDPAHYGKRALERAELDGLRFFQGVYFPVGGEF